MAKHHSFRCPLGNWPSCQRIVIARFCSGALLPLFWGPDKDRLPEPEDLDWFPGICSLWRGGHPGQLGSAGAAGGAAQLAPAQQLLRGRAAAGGSVREDRGGTGSVRISGGAFWMFFREQGCGFIQPL